MIFKISSRSAGSDSVSVAAELAPLGVLIIFVTADYQQAAEGCECGADTLIKPVRYLALVGSVAAVFNPNFLSQLFFHCKRASVRVLLLSVVFSAGE